MSASSVFNVDSTKTLDYTFHYSGLSCWKPMYFAHIAFAYLVFLSGVLAFVTRLDPRMHFLHVWMGKAYIISMLWATATSLLIHNTGLPTGVLYSFIWALSGLSLGWIAITLRQRVPYFQPKPIDYANPPTRTQVIINRFFSVKTFHGVVMFTSWINIAGRIFVTPLDPNFECYTYPVYKSVAGSRHYNYTAGAPVEYVPIENPNYNRVPWANREQQWAAMLSLGPIAGACLVAILFIFFTTKTRQPVKPSP